MDRFYRGSVVVDYYANHIQHFCVYSISKNRWPITQLPLALCFIGAKSSGLRFAWTTSVTSSFDVVILERSNISTIRWKHVANRYLRKVVTVIVAWSKKYRCRNIGVNNLIYPHRRLGFPIFIISPITKNNLLCPAVHRAAFKEVANAYRDHNKDWTWWNVNVRYSLNTNYLF